MISSSPVHWNIKCCQSDSFQPPISIFIDVFAVGNKYLKVDFVENDTK